MSMAAGALAELRRDEVAASSYVAGLFTAAGADARLAGSSAERPTQHGKDPPPPRPPSLHPYYFAKRMTPGCAHSAGGKECDVCEEAQSRYTCPGCGAKTCSLTCSKGAGRLPCTSSFDASMSAHCCCTSAPNENCKLLFVPFVPAIGTWYRCWLYAKRYGTLA